MELRSRSRSIERELTPTKRNTQSNPTAAAGLHEEHSETGKEILPKERTRKETGKERPRKEIVKKVRTVDGTKENEDSSSKPNLDDQITEDNTIGIGLDSTESTDKFSRTYEDSLSSTGEESEDNTDGELESQSESESLIPEKAEHKDVKTDDQSLNIALGVIAVAICVLISATSLFTDTSQTTVRDQKVFIEELVGLKKDFSNQHPFMWRLVQGAFQHHHVMRNNTEPAVFFLGHQQQKETTDCLATKLAKLYSHNCNQRNDIAVLDGSDYADMDAKMKIKRDIDAAYDKGACAVVMKDFDKIDPLSTLIFYYFCDNSLSSYNNKAIIFTMDLYDSTLDEQQDIEDYPLKWEPLVNNYLEDSLQRRSHAMNEDKTKALLSRVTPLVGFVKPESDLNMC